MRAAIDRAFPSGLLADPNAVLDLGNDRATDGTVRADILAQHGIRWLRSSSPGFLHTADGQRAEDGKAACAKAALAQERSPIEGAACLAFECCDKGASAGPPFALFDEHDVTSLAWIFVDAVKSLHVVRFLVARLSLFIVGLAVGVHTGRQRGGGRCHPCANTQRTQNTAAVDL